MRRVVHVGISSHGKVDAVNASCDAMKDINRALLVLYGETKGKHIRRNDPVSIAITGLQRAYHEASHAHAHLLNDVPGEDFK